MLPDELQEHFHRIDTLVAEMDKFAPEGKRGAIEFRADLAGMLVVTIAAMYETCVKATMVSYASKYGREFEGFTDRNFSKLSSKIAHQDLRRYAKTFDEGIRDKFDEILTRRRKVTVKLAGRNPINQLEQILNWRHDFAHAGRRQTTISEAIATHRLASVVILSFHSAFQDDLEA